MDNFYSQGEEDKKVSEFLQFSKGTFLDIGANDGKLLSNSLHFIEKGWGATLIEASPVAFKKLAKLHTQNSKVQCIQACLDSEEKETTFYHNLNHYNQGDTDLLSTINESSYLDSSKKFPFETLTVKTNTWEQVKSQFKYRVYDVISIDIEGKDYEILCQINLKELQCKALIIEYNNNLVIKQNICNYGAKHGLTNILFDNQTNIILTK
jgi:FkbM family methyltransferase